MAKTIFYERTQRVSKILFLPRENEIRIFAPPCNILYLCSSLFIQVYLINKKNLIQRRSLTYKTSWLVETSSPFVFFLASCEFHVIFYYFLSFISKKALKINKSIITNNQLSISASVSVLLSLSVLPSSSSLSLSLSLILVYHFHNIFLLSMALFSCIDCVDKNPNCRKWTRYCSYHQYVRANCKKTCNLC